MTDCAVQVVLESADKSVNAYQISDDFRCEKSTQVNELHGLLHKEVNKIEQDEKEIGWINPQKSKIEHHSRGNHYYINWAIDAKLCIESYAKSSAIPAKLCVEKYTEMEGHMNRNFWSVCSYYYIRDKDGNFYHTEEDDVVEVLTEEQLKGLYSTYTDYINNFARVSNERRNIAFLIYKKYVCAYWLEE